MKLTTNRRRFLQALAEHGPFSRLPAGVQFPSDVVLAHMERAGYIERHVVGPIRKLVGINATQQRVEFDITDAGRDAMAEIEASDDA